MSWLCSQALVEEFSAGTCSDGEPSAQLNVMPTQHKFWRNDKTIEPCDLSRFGLTCAVLTADRGEALLTWFREASRARTSALPAKAQALTALAAECGATWRASWARFDPSTSSWKTAQPSLLADSDESSVTWPRSGMTAGGLCWELPMSAPPTSVTGFGLWVPTPCTVDSGSYFNKSDSPGAALRPTLGAMAKHGLWPTPTVCGNHNRKGASATSGDGLATAVKTWATPLARDYRHPGRSRMERTGGTHGEALPQQVGGALNPTWVEWLMGWPLGWTDLKPLATGKFHSALQQRGECSQAVEA